MQARNQKWAILIVIFTAALTAGIFLNQTHQSSTPESFNSLVKPDNGDLKINWDRYSSTEVELSSSYEITRSGIYHLTGNLIGGLITINTGNEGEVKLILDNVFITNSNGPAIACYSANDLVIELVGNNILMDSATYQGYDDDVSGTIYTKSDLTFQGDGTLNLTANFADGIVSKDDLKFNSGTYNITSADDAIRGKDSVYIVDGEFNLIATSDAIKSTNTADTNKGFVMIENGDINIKSGDDAIHASTKLIINNGDINISSSYEGLEAPIIAINGGKLSITSSDDGINAGGGASKSTNNQPHNKDPFEADTNCILSINDGDIYVNASGDGIDSNGYLYFNGGTTIVDGPTNNGNGALDAGADIVMNGGTVIAVGASGMAETLGASSLIYNASIYFNTTLPANTTIAITDQSGNLILSHTSAKTFSHIAVGTPNFKKSATYTIYINDVEYQSFTITSSTTTVGNNRPSQIIPGADRR